MQYTGIEWHGLNNCRDMRIAIATDENKYRAKKIQLHSWTKMAARYSNRVFTRPTYARTYIDCRCDNNGYAMMAEIASDSSRTQRRYEKCVFSVADARERKKKSPQIFLILIARMCECVRCECCLYVRVCGCVRACTIFIHGFVGAAHTQSHVKSAKNRIVWFYQVAKRLCLCRGAMQYLLMVLYA